MKSLILSLLLMSFSSISLAYDGAPTKQVEMFFKDQSNRKVSESIDNLYSNNPAMQQKVQALTFLKQQLASVSVLYGNLIGNENISKEELSPSLVRIVQVAKYDIHPVVWEFYFYKPKDKWIVSQAMFVDQFQVVGSKK